MDELIPRIVKSVFMGAVMFGAAWMLSDSLRIAAAASLVPLVLGLINVMSGLANTLTALVLVAAVAVQVFGGDEIKNKLRSTVDSVKGEAGKLVDKLPSGK